ncbi:MAG TPA: hypothetical protein VG165_04435 [Solirubrobacteraceae bacterium]|jgi:hypothetical protein|nr:hypothetical protein [Solirubrobacteraceae bacterium]
MKTQRADRLRATVDFLPHETKRAMLDGLERNRIITGANTDRRGGVCPMVAADRNAFESGPMADLFAAVWDGYTGACVLNRRDASERDLRVLKTMLETSLANSPQLSSELGQSWLDYHTDTASADPGADFDQELTAALKESSLLDTGSFAPSAASPSPALSPSAVVAHEPPAGPRRIELIYDGGPLPRRPAPAPAPAQRSTVAQPIDRGELRGGSDAPGVATSSTYEPYKIAAPKNRAPVKRASVDVPSRAARHAAETAASAERARARAIIANQAATLNGRAWPRSGETRPAPVAAPRAESVEARFAAPAIVQAAIPQRRTLPTEADAPASAAPTRAGRTADRTPDAHGRTGWSLLPPARSYDEHSEPREAPGQVEPGSPAVPDGGERSPART